jgi:hypothetical protein
MTHKENQNIPQVIQRRSFNYKAAKTQMRAD